MTGLQGPPPPPPLSLRGTIGWLAAEVRPQRREAVGLAALLVAGTILPLAGPRIMGWIFDHALLAAGPEAGRLRLLGFGLLALIGVEIASFLLGLRKENASTDFSERLVRRIQLGLYDRVQSFSGAELDRFAPSLLYLRIGENARQIGYILQEGMGAFLLAPLTCLGIFAILLATHPLLALLGLVPCRSSRSWPPGIRAGSAISPSGPPSRRNAGSSGSRRTSPPSA